MKIETNCPHCGAPMSRAGNVSVCQYCGTRTQSGRIACNWDETHIPGLYKVRAEVHIPFDSMRYCSPQDIMDAAKHKLALQIADSVAENMELYIVDDPFTYERKVMGQIFVGEGGQSY